MTTPIPNLARAMLAFAEGFAQLAAHFGAPAGTVAVEIGMEPAKPAEKEENPAPAPAEVQPELKFPPVECLEEAPAAPAPLDEAGLRELTVRAFEAGCGTAVREFLAGQAVQRVSQLSQDARESFRVFLAGKGVQ